ncbi:tumor protein p53-inducible protein 11 isoform X1 [Procambarus clarkii]|uniref:tumor protein p53-inducible protein 11 isoform X1 n=1 Tax=Procambarus clarkii TaxID=6728 RepID=UPI001E678ABB|nr:tumor protein p53-inducible protein 11-like isoform X2 [Procambarus clarkii]
MSETVGDVPALVPAHEGGATCVTTNDRAGTTYTKPPSAPTECVYPQRKHSSGDLHSRLKTRKILGVGETDNGDIHRSKISQVLGHNEHLYVRLPRGFWSAHVLMGAGVTVETLLLLLFPGIAAHLGVMPPDMTEADDDPQGAGVTASRVAGAALAGLCVFVWSLLGTSDKHYARTMLLSMLTYHILSICVGAASAFTQQNEDEALLENRLVMIIGMRAVMCLICLAYFYSIAGYTPIRGQKPSGFRQPSQGPKEH